MGTEKEIEEKQVIETAYLLSMSSNLKQDLIDYLESGNKILMAAAMLVTDILMD